MAKTRAIMEDGGWPGVRKRFGWRTRVQLIDRENSKNKDWSKELLVRPQCLRLYDPRF